MLTYSGLVRLSRHEPPRLDTVLDLCAGRIAVDIEVKEVGYEAEVIEEASRRFPRDRLLYTSFEEPVVSTIKRLDPDARCGLLLGPGRLRSRTPAIRGLPFDLAERCGADLLAVHQWLAPVGGASDGGLPDLLVRRKTRVPDHGLDGRRAHDCAHISSDGRVRG